MTDKERLEQCMQKVITLTMWTQAAQCLPKGETDRGLDFNKFLDEWFWELHDHLGYTVPEPTRDEGDAIDF